jgi:SAM-dependent methyltransferase
MLKVLHVGCGAATIERMPRGFRSGQWQEIRYDIDPAAEPDIVGSITNMAAIATEACDAIYSSHNLEHVFAHEVPAVLCEFRRVLNEKGFAVITCPDLQAVATQVALGRLLDPLYESPAGPIAALDILYGHGASISRGQTYMAHKTGFTAETLTSQARAAGFRTIGIRRRAAQFDLWLLASKAATPKEELVQLMNDFTFR